MGAALCVVGAHTLDVVLASRLAAVRVAGGTQLWGCARDCDRHIKWHALQDGESGRSVGVIDQLVGLEVCVQGGHQARRAHKLRHEISQGLTTAQAGAIAGWPHADSQQPAALMIPTMPGLLGAEQFLFPWRVLYAHC